MDTAENLSIVTGLIKEVEGYLPEMSSFLETLSTDTEKDPAITGELHRMAHTIKGASAMVGLEELSKTAALMEDALDDTEAGKLAWSSQLIAAMNLTVNGIQKYCSALHDGKVDNSDLYQNSLTAFTELEGYQIPAPFTTEDSTDDFADDSDDDLLFNLLEDEDDEEFDNDLGFLLDTVDQVSEEINLDSAMSADPPALKIVIDPELQDCFNEEAEEHLENLGRQINALASSVTGRMNINDAHRDRLHSITRSVHTMKGAAAVIGIDPVAAWGHSFEDFLDWLNDECTSLSPEVVTLLLDASDLLEKIALDPSMQADRQINSIQQRFQKIIREESPLSPEQEDIAEDSGAGETISATVKEQLIEQITVQPEQAPQQDDQNQGKRKDTREKTLRVPVKRIDTVAGLSGDMTINLTSFEDTRVSLLASMNEFSITLQRLKGIASSLETGYELSTIPHLGDAATASETEGVMEEFDPLEMDRYSELHILIRSLNEAVVDLESIGEQTAGVSNEWRIAVERQRAVVTEVQNALHRIQMIPFSTLSNRLYRTVRESARATDKSVRLLIEGGTMEMAAHVWDILSDPLMHMLRNSVDHAIEEQEERIKADKSEQATIRITCSRRGNRFVLRLSDDGRGLDYKAIRRRGIVLYPGTGVDKMNHRQLASLIFKQGFSIRSKVTTISGRGVGMDVVNNALDQLQGTVEVLSSQGQGCVFILSLPIAVAQLPALLVNFGNQMYAVPMHDISQVLRVTEKQALSNHIKLDNKTMPVFRPAELLGFAQAEWSELSTREGEDSFLALAVDVGEQQGVIVTDKVIGQRDVVFKPLGSHLKKVPAVAGATIMGDGRLVPILQSEDLFSLHAQAMEEDAVTGTKLAVREKPLHILVADDSISIRKVLTSFIAGQGWIPTVARDGVDALGEIWKKKPDVILLDIEMPRMDGFEVLKSLQAQEDYRDIPTLMLTSRTGQKYRDKAVELGADGFVTKPFNDEQLVSLIRQVTGKRSEAETPGDRKERVLL